MYVVFATATYFPFGLLNGFFFPFFTNFLAFAFGVPFEKPSPDDSAFSAYSEQAAGSSLISGFVVDGGKLSIEPSLSLSTAF